MIEVKGDFARCSRDIVSEHVNNEHSPCNHDSRNGHPDFSSPGDGKKNACK